MDDETTAGDPTFMVARLVELLRSLPAGTNVTWGTETADDAGWIKGWCDIWAPDLARPLEWSWVWTVTADAIDDLGPLHITLPSEGDERPGWSTATVSAALKAWTTHQAGRWDLEFVYDPELVADWIAAVIERSERP